MLARATVPYHDGKLALVTSGAVTASLRIGAKIATKVTAPSSVERPVSRGQVLGTVRVVRRRSRGGREAPGRGRLVRQGELNLEGRLPGPSRLALAHVAPLRAIRGALPL